MKMSQQKVKLPCSYSWMLLVLCWLSASSAFAQERITLKVENEPFTYVIKLIARQSNYSFNFPQRWDQYAKRINLDVINEPIADVLDLCFEDHPFAYKFINSTIVINWKQAQADSMGLHLIPKAHVWVTDTSGMAISLVTIKSMRTGRMYLVNEVGQIVLEDLDKRDSLLFTATNYRDTLVGATSPLLVEMEVAASTLDAVNVHPYDPLDSIKIYTGNVSVINATDLLRQPISDFSAGLSGRVPGLLSSQSSGVPGAQVNLQLRGRNSLLTGNDMLIVLDGVPLMHAQRSASNLKSAATHLENGTGLSPLMDLNIADIENISILKDAAATALYGIQGGNGVLLITTKKGKKGKPSLQAGFQTGWSKAVQRVDWMNTEEYLQLREDAFRLDGRSITPATAPDLFWNRKAYTNFPKLLTGKTARHISARVSVSDGSDHTWYRLSGNHYMQDQVFSGPFKDSRTTAMMNLRHKASNRLTLNFTLLYGYNRSMPPRVDLSMYNNLPPHLQLLDSVGKPNWMQNGEYIYLIPGLTNPLSYRDKYYSFASKHLLSSVQVSYHLGKDCMIRLHAGFNQFDTDERFASPKRSLPPGTNTVRKAEFGKGRNKDWIMEPQFIYRHTMRTSQLMLLGSITILQSKAANSVINASGYQDDASLHSPDFAEDTVVSADLSRYRYTAFSLNANYVLKDRYMMNVTVRADGSNRFGGKMHYTPLGAVGAAWIFSKTEFVKKYLPFISSGKFRASWGMVGNDQVGDGKQAGYWQPDVSYRESVAAQVTNFFDPSYTWEKVYRSEAGIEMGFLKDQLNIHLAFYRNRSSDLLAKKPVPNGPSSFNIISNSRAVVENKGMELIIHTNARLFRRLNWSCQFNITIPSNKLVTFPDIDSTRYGKQYKAGYSLNAYNAYTGLGVDPETGLFRVATSNANGIATAQDMQLAGHIDPQYYGGIQNSFFTRQWEFSFFMDFRKQMMQNYMSNADSHQPGYPMNQPKEVIDRWNNEGDMARWLRPSAITGGDVYTAAYNMAHSTDAYTNTFFIRIKNVELSYLVPIERTKLKHLESCRLYVQAQNLFTFTNYRGDPETQNVSVLPLLRTIAIGIDITL